MGEPMNTEDYLENLNKWQAISHPDLAESKPEQLLEAGFVERYNRLHHDLWWRIIRVHGTLYTLKQLKEFPFDYVYPPGHMEFWRLVVENFIDTACLMLDGLVNDKGKDVHTLRTFRNEIITNWKTQAKAEPVDDPVAKLELLKSTLRERKFDEEVDSIAERVHKIRDNIAHRLIERQNGSPKEALIGVSLEELWKLFYAAHSLFSALSFGGGYVTLAGDLMPGTVGGKPTRTCLDGVLDAVLRDSALVNRPERRAQWWPDEREHIPPKVLQIMNEMRKRVGLREV
jgi:hypothetical protein